MVEEAGEEVEEDLPAPIPPANKLERSQSSEEWALTTTKRQLRIGRKLTETVNNYLVSIGKIGADHLKELTSGEYIKLESPSYTDGEKEQHEKKEKIRKDRAEKKKAIAIDEIAHYKGLLEAANTGNQKDKLQIFDLQKKLIELAAEKEDYELEANTDRPLV